MTDVGPSAGLGVLYVFCGKMAAGKSTLAKALAGEQRAILLSEDEWLAHLYPNEIDDVAAYARYSTRVKAALESHICSLLLMGQSVVLDFAANTVRQRSWIRKLVDQTNAPHELHYLEVSDETCLSRLAKRRQEQPERQATDTVEMFHAVTAYFQPPNPEEGFVLIRHEAR